MRQLPLGVGLGVSLRFETFAEGRNAGAVEALRRLADGTTRTPVWIYGPPGSGKSHLLQAACARAGDAGRTTAWLPLARVKDDGPALLEGFDGLDLVALDDVEAVTGLPAWESALFTLYNGIVERRGRVAFAASQAPAGTAVRLPDLASRLAASEVHRLEPLSEAEQGTALQQRAKWRGLELPEETLGFLTRRAPRDFATLCRMLDALDADSLAAQRRLTIPFVREWLARNAG